MTSEPEAIAAVRAEIADLERRAERIETPCGAGVIVWRVWGSGAPLLLAHGAHGSWLHWIRNIPELARHRRLLVPDLPGYGESAMPSTADHAGIASLLATGLRRLVTRDEPIDLVGFSFGGIIAAHLAVIHHELARRVIVVDSGGLDTPLGDMNLRRVRGLDGSERNAALRANLLGLMLHAPESVDALALYLQATVPPLGRLDARPLVMPDKFLVALRQLNVQLDAIWGEFDRPHPPAAQQAALRRFDPHLDFEVIAGAGHWVMYEKPVEFNRVLLDLLAQPLRHRETSERLV